MSICIECNKNESLDNYFNRCQKCLELKHWECKKCGNDIAVTEYDNGGKCDECNVGNEINELYNKIKFDIENYIEQVDNIEYQNKLVDGIIIYFADGTAYQIFIDEHDNYNIIDENLNVLSNLSIETIYNSIFAAVEERNNIINNSNDYISL